MVCAYELGLDRGVAFEVVDDDGVGEFDVAGFVDECCEIRCGDGVGGGLRVAVGFYFLAVEEEFTGAFVDGVGVTETFFDVGGECGAVFDTEDSAGLLDEAKLRRDGV